MLFNYPFPGILIGNPRDSSIPREGWHHPQAGTACRLTLWAPERSPIVRRTRSSGDPACPRARASSSRLSTHSRKSLGILEPQPPPLGRQPRQSPSPPGGAGSLGAARMGRAPVGPPRARPLPRQRPPGRPRGPRGERAGALRQDGVGEAAGCAVSAGRRRSARPGAPQVRPPARARPAGPWRRQVRARGGLSGCRGPGAPLASARVTFPRRGPPRPRRHAPRAAAPPRCRLRAAAGARSAGRRGSTMALTLFGECGPRLPAAVGPRPGSRVRGRGREARGGPAAESGLLERGPARRSHCLLSGRADGRELPGRSWGRGKRLVPT